ncbi:TDT family transporter [Mollicutes bacterium LVI A0078]|nr:TDT family transporter [Mollicutes bacterium LVI A0075]WOO91875.1 TDT family transporter [Mollicutes bacterium LVI A0078]
MKHFRNLPVGVIGTALGLCTLSNAYNVIGLSWVRVLSMLIGIVIWVIAFRKIVFNFDKVKTEYSENTVTATLYATFAMLTMVLSSFIVSYIPVLGKALWLAGIAMQSALIVMLFGLHIFKKRNLDVILPSWYVTLLGLLVSTAIGTEMGFPTLQKIIVIYGFLMYFGTIAFVVYRLFKKDLPKPARYTKTILLAPISLIIVGYINVYENKSQLLVTVLMLILAITMLYVLTQTKSFMEGGFTPGYAALTFPHAIAIIASLKLSTYFTDINPSLSAGLHQIAGVQIFFTTAVILFTLYSFVIRRADWN